MGGDGTQADGTRDGRIFFRPHLRFCLKTAESVALFLLLTLLNGESIYHANHWRKTDLSSSAFSMFSLQSAFININKIKT